MYSCAVADSSDSRVIRVNIGPIARFERGYPGHGVLMDYDAINMEDWHLSQLFSLCRRPQYFGYIGLCLLPYDW